MFISLFVSYEYTWFVSVINIFIGIRLEETDTSNQAYYVFLGYESFQIAMIVVLEVLRFLEGKQAKPVECKFMF